MTELCPACTLFLEFQSTWQRLVLMVGRTLKWFHWVVQADLTQVDLWRFKTSSEHVFGLTHKRFYMSFFEALVLATLLPLSNSPSFLYFLGDGRALGDGWARLEGAWCGPLQPGAPHWKWGGVCVLAQNAGMYGLCGSCFLGVCHRPFLRAPVVVGSVLVGFLWGVETWKGISQCWTFRLLPSPDVFIYSF